ncbi:calcium-activated chloride channel regulator 1-like isoform X1 [Silurus meridionalis]|uniref:calcium-activated chloride channel regulator 1-like isoform X1 n=2 Tax=Silurus meridionalis TaxID=175797 RepID=UPI001EEC5C3E|nr:calcium-activated chloride channel regulator 1-like isoform X1 [Silurus meridionalis]
MFVVVLLFVSLLRPFTSIRLDGNGYTDILIVINPAVPENEDIINQTKGMITHGSEYLFQALDNKVFIKEVKILVPPNWTKGKYEKAKTETFNKGKIRIDNPHPAFGDDPYTHQTKGCGNEGEYIHFTPNFLLNNNLLKGYGPRGRVFVHEWAQLRWGVFHEYNKKKPFYVSAGQILPTRCTDKISGQWYEIVNQRPRPCEFDSDGLPASNCEFLPDAMQSANASIMYMPSIDSVRAFCQEEDHNNEAPNEQNEKCSKATRTVIFQDSVDKDALRILKPLSVVPPPPTFKVIQRGPRVVCLVLDVSGSMGGPRITLQRQAATVFLNQIIEEQQFVGIVTFSSEAQILSPLTIIDGQASRDNLIRKLPTIASGGTYICKGLRKGFEVLQTDDGKTIGDEIILLTDGEASDNVQDCLPEAIQSGAVMNTIAFGPNADNVLRTMADQTDGKFIVAEVSILSTQLVDGFSSLTMSDGNSFTQPIQIESTGKSVKDWFNGTVPIDRTVGNRTTFTIIYGMSAPIVNIVSPSGLVYKQTNTTDIAYTITLTVPGTAETGEWKYSFFNKGATVQQMSLLVISRAAHKDVHPVTVTARMNQQTSDGTKPMVVLAEVSQNYNPVLGASVWANLESDTGHSERLQLLDNGAGADAFKEDGVYSRYFTTLKRGKYSLKVRVENQHGEGQFSPDSYSGALYVAGYIVDGKVELNPPKPPVNVQPVDVGNFTRTVTGESFVVDRDAPPNFPPNKITDLRAEIQEDTVLLNWTAPGEDFDQGTAKSYDIRWSEDLKMLQNNFSSNYLVNTSSLLPQVSGSAEQYTFQPNITIQNGTTLFFAIQSLDKQLAKSEVSNIARATKYVPNPKFSPISKPGLGLPAIVVSVFLVIIMPCFIFVVITRALKRKKQT